MNQCVLLLVLIATAGKKKKAYMFKSNNMMSVQKNHGKLHKSYKNVLIFF